MILNKFIWQQSPNKTFNKDIPPQRAFCANSHKNTQRYGMTVNNTLGLKHMRHICLLLLTIVPAYAAATSDLMCSGEVYSAYIVVGTDDDDYTKDAIAEVNLYPQGQIKPTTLNNHVFIVRDINWIDGEEGFSLNSLRIEMKNKDTNEVVKITANGENGILDYKTTQYELVCNWER